MKHLSEQQIASNREEIISLLSSTDRMGIDNVIAYLDESGFFTAPSSLDRHHNWRGGLAQHCLGVCRIALKMGGNLPQDSIIIAGILHDVCKASKLFYDENGQVHRRLTHIQGHGRRSLLLLQNRHLQLTEDERLAIRWHMGGHHAHGNEVDEVRTARLTPLWKVIHRADQLDASGIYRFWSRLVS